MKYLFIQPYLKLTFELLRPWACITYRRHLLTMSFFCLLKGVIGLDKYYDLPFNELKISNLKSMNIFFNVLTFTFKDNNDICYISVLAGIGLLFALVLVNFKIIYTRKSEIQTYGMMYSESRMSPSPMPAYSPPSQTYSPCSSSYVHVRLSLYRWKLGEHIMFDLWCFCV